MCGKVGKKFSDVLLFICGLTAILGANINEKIKQF